MYEIFLHDYLYLKNIPKEKYFSKFRKEENLNRYKDVESKFLLESLNVRLRLRLR